MGHVDDRADRRRRRYAHQPQRRIYFSDIEPAWLRALAKRWARWRITSVSLSPAAAAGTTSALRSFSRWLTAERAVPATPMHVTRGLLERYLVHARDLSTGQKRRLLSNLRAFLDDVRMHEWAPGLPGNVTYFDGEIPHGSTRRLPRFVDEFVMGQIERADNLARLPDLAMQTAIVVLIETGLRSIDALRLRFDPITVDTAGAPYLIYTNHKLARQAVIPISQRLLEQIGRQQTDVARRYKGEQRHYLLPRLRSNHDGTLPTATTGSAAASQAGWPTARSATPPAGPCTSRRTSFATRSPPAWSTTRSRSTPSSGCSITTRPR